MIMLSEKMKARLAKDRPMISITIRMPVDAVESMKAIAPHKGLSGYQSLLKSYVSEGLRKDEAQYAFSAEARLIEALKRRGVPDDVLQDAARELHPA
jgi:hypothetical protein